MPINIAYHCYRDPDRQAGGDIIVQRRTARRLAKRNRKNSAPPSCRVFHNGHGVMAAKCLNQSSQRGTARIV